MTLNGVRPGDLIRAEPRNQLPFHAKVLEAGKGELVVQSLANGRREYVVKAREVAEHWRKRRSRS